MGTGECTPTPFTIFTISYKVVVHAPAERAVTLPLFLHYPFGYSVGEVWRMTDGPWIFLSNIFLFWMAPVQSSTYREEEEDFSTYCSEAGLWGEGGWRGGGGEED